MPKEPRRRSRTHQSPVKLNHRSYAVKGTTVERVEIGGAVEAKGTDILETLSTREPRVMKKKKKKKSHQLKRDAFLRRLETSGSSHSKSYARRMKRKAKEQIAGGLHDMQLAITALDQSSPQNFQQSVDTKGITSYPPPKPTVKPGLIGEGKNATLSASQRKRALQLEQVRHPLILSNPDFASNPFQSIRTHAQNTLIKKSS